jgi:hypothetical protein
VGGVDVPHGLERLDDPAREWRGGDLEPVVLDQVICSAATVMPSLSSSQSRSIVRAGGDVLDVAEEHPPRERVLPHDEALFTSPVFLPSKDVGICGDLVFTQYPQISSNTLPQKYSTMMESF